MAGTPLLPFLKWFPYGVELFLFNVACPRISNFTKRTLFEKQMGDFEE